MLTTKKRGQIFGLLFCVAFAFLLTACTPPGQRALLAGARLIDEGKFSEAVPKLEEATRLLAQELPVVPVTVQAQAWNHLGLAYHQSGQATRAIEAYQKALKLDRNLVAANFNLGCLQLEQRNFNAGIDALTTYVSWRPKDAKGFLKIGSAHLRLAAQSSSAAERNKQLDSARKNFEAAQKLSPTAEALNALGMIQLQRNRAPADALKDFKMALQQQPNYAPALLNIAVVYHQTLNDHRMALQKYRDYLKVQPHPEVEAIAHELELELNPRPVATNAATRVAPANSISATNKPAVVSNISAKTETNLTKVPSQVSANTKPTALAKEPVVQVKVQEETPIQPQNAAVAAPTKPIAPASNSTARTETKTPADVSPKKTSLLQKINPVSWFGKKDKPAPVAAPLTNSPAIKVAVAPAAPVTNVGNLSPVTPLPSKPAPIRYKYISPTKPADGDRVAAQQFFSQAIKAQKEKHLPPALEAYRRATKSDPGFFDGWFYFGLAASDAGDFAAALGALENALAIKPDSSDARYAFGWTLQKGNYFQDAANELEKLLIQSPNEIRAHLLLANLYSQKLDQTKLAREHYLKVLEADPRNSQATSIRYWLAAHP